MVFGVGWLEIGVIGVIAVLVFGPERLPRMIAQTAQWVRVIRAQATSARDDLMAAADIDPALTSDLRRSVSELAELHPRKMASSLLSEVSAPFTDAARTAKDLSSGSTPTADGSPSAAPADGASPRYDSDAT